MAQNKFQPCRLCGTATPAVINIKFKPVPICEGCCAAVFIQQAQWYTEQDYSHLYKAKLPEDEQAVFDLTGQEGDGNWEILEVQRPVVGTKGYKGELSFAKVNDQGKATHMIAGGDKVPKIRIRVVRSLVKRGLIRAYNTHTRNGVTYTYYKRA